jgi:hypothetical protein
MVGSKEWKWSPSVLSIMFNQMFYHLVNIQKTMESHHFSWENPLFLWPFSIAKCYKLPGIMAYQVVSLVILHSLSISSPAIPGRWGTSSICHPVYLQPMWCSEPSIWILCIYIYIYITIHIHIYIYICTILEFDIYKYMYIYNSCSPWHQVVSYQSLFQRYWRLGHAEALRFRGTPRFRRRGIQRFPMKNPDLSDKNMIIVICPGFVTCSKNMMILMSIFRWF